MKPTSKQAKKLILLIADNEALTSHLYDAYAKNFPEEEVFWQELSIDEARHYEWVTKLFEYAKEYEITISDERIDSKIAKELKRDVERMILLANKVNIKQAYNNAVKIEFNLAERDYFSILHSTKRSVMIILESLETSSKRHLKLVLEKQSKKH